MSKRIQADWLVLDSLEDANQENCIDFFIRPDQSFGFEAFRRAPEDQGSWQPLSHFSILHFDDFSVCLNEAIDRFEWLAWHFPLDKNRISYIEKILNRL